MRRAATALLLAALAACDGAPPARAPSARPTRLPPTGWQTRCVDWVRVALGEMATIEPALARALPRPRHGPGGREEVVVAMHPPHHPVNLRLVVARSPSDTPGPWERHVEVFDGRAFLTAHLREASGEADLVLDGWEGRPADAVATRLQRAAERCLETTP